MYSSLTAVVLCIFSQAGLAQCVDSRPAALDSHPGIELAKKVMAAPMPVAGATRAGGELITTAAAGTHDASPVAREDPVAATAEEEPHRRGGAAMLLAALALMSGIALRRYGANDQ